MSRMSFVNFIRSLIIVAIVILVIAIASNAEAIAKFTLPMDIIGWISVGYIIRLATDLINRKR